MIIIDDKIVTDGVIAEQFVCNLDACKGACCWEGDYGAPLEDEELQIMEDIQEKVRPYLSEEGIQAIEELGPYVYEKSEKEYATTLINRGACAYMTYNSKGVAMCGIEQAYRDGAIDFYKPISCHLYPVRIEKLKFYEALNYDKWDICSAACENGKKLSVPVYQFVKPAIIRKYGEDFFKALEIAVEDHLENNMEIED